jgi:hypothetical protein
MRASLEVVVAGDVDLAPDTEVAWLLPHERSLALINVRLTFAVVRAIVAGEEVRDSVLTGGGIRDQPSAFDVAGREAGGLEEAIEVVFVEDLVHRVLAEVVVSRDRRSVEAAVRDAG